MEMKNIKHTPNNKGKVNYEKLIKQIIDPPPPPVIKKNERY